jgi:hypothetical protein
MRSHFSLPPKVAAACAVASATLLLNGNCSAQSFLASDWATNSDYAAGWAEGQNGGWGFGPWSMANTLSSPVQSVLDTNTPNNPFGVAWTIYNADGPPTGSCYDPPNGGSDISRAGRACPALQPGQTFSTVISNPTARHFYRGYTIRLVTGGENTSYSTQTNTLVAVGTFEYNSFGRWYTTQSYHTGRTSLFDTDTTTNGMRLDITMLTTNTYHLVMTPLDNPGIAYSEDGALAKNAPVTWIEYEFYNTDSGYYPPPVLTCSDRTDFYIKSMSISVPLLLNIQRTGTNVVLSWPTNAPGSTLEYAPSPGSGGEWKPVSQSPAVVNDQNVVTNPVVGAQLFYRLRQ